MTAKMSKKSTNYILSVSERDLLRLWLAADTGEPGFLTGLLKKILKPAMNELKRRCPVRSVIEHSKPVRRLRKGWTVEEKK